MGDDKGLDSPEPEGGPLWSDLKIFLFAAERQSIRAAARELGISQPTASQRIRTLEGALGTHLFVRRANAVTLTDAGREVLEQARAMHRAMEAIERSVRKRDVQLRGRVRIAAPDGLAGCWISTQVHKLYEGGGDISLLLDAGIWPNDPLRTEVDVSIQFEQPTNADLQVETLAWVHYGIFASPKFIARHGRPKTLEEMRALPLLNHVAYRHQKDKWDKGITEGPWSPPIFETNSSPGMLAALSTGAALGLAPTWAVLQYPDIEMLTPCLMSLDLYLVYHKDVAKIARVRRVMEWLREAFDGEQHPWFRKDFVHPDAFPKQT